MKKVILAIMEMCMMGSLFAPVCYATETKDIMMITFLFGMSSEDRRVGKESISRMSAYH